MKKLVWVAIGVGILIWILSQSRVVAVEAVEVESKVAADKSKTSVDIYDKKAVIQLIRDHAKQFGVNPEMAVYMFDIESHHFDPDVISGKRDGDTNLVCWNAKSPIYGQRMRSRGLTQNNNCWNPDVPDEVAYDPHAALNWAMPRMKVNPDLWSTHQNWLIALAGK